MNSKQSDVQSDKIVISASRRTDIPAFYIDWFMKRIEIGSFETPNPYNGAIRKIRALPSNVHTIVFWSKNFSVFLKKNCGEKLKKKGFNLFFNFTINSESEILEPNTLSLEERINQLKEISCRFGSETISWRFDPVCFYSNENNEVKNNLYHFKYIAEKASELNIKRCVTSFLDIYPKIKKRVKLIPNFLFIEISVEKKKEILSRMEKLLFSKNISLYTCCEKEVLDILPKESRIKQNSCIDADLLAKLYGKNLSYKKDKGQRVKSGCGCTISYDIGSYVMHPCFNGCLFCYANPR